MTHVHLNKVQSEHTTHPIVANDKLKLCLIFTQDS